MSEYPTYTRSERIADGTVHGLGISFGLIGTVFLIIWSYGHGALTVSAAAVYGLALTACFTASACYHMTPWEALRPQLRRLDHALIYLKIAGTYTPLVVLMGTGLAYSILGVVWALPIVGMTLKLAFWRTPGRFGPALYLAMGWLCVAIIWPLAQTIPTPATWLIVIGGLTYSGGVVFYTAEGLKFSNAIWHALVLIASICFFAAISLAIQAS